MSHSKNPKFARLLAGQCCVPEAEQAVVEVTELIAALLSVLQETEVQVLPEEQRRLRDIADAVPAMIAKLDLSQRFTYCNEKYREWMGIAPKWLVGKRLLEAVGEEHFAPRRPFIERAYAGERTVFEHHVSLPIGQRWLQTIYTPRIAPSGAIVGIYALTSDITELKETQEKLNAMAREDVLTGLPNRRVFEERLGNAIARGQRHGGVIAVLYLDVDHFKSINDTCGHAAGDSVLKEVGLRLVQCIRHTDTVTRYAGDEFLLLLEGLHASDEAAEIATSILEVMRASFSV